MQFRRQRARTLGVRAGRLVVAVVGLGFALVDVGLAALATKAGCVTVAGKVSVSVAAFAAVEAGVTLAVVNQSWRLRRRRRWRRAGGKPTDGQPSGVEQSEQLDLLFVIDNSISMVHEQQLFAEALPDMVGRLVSPVCVAADGRQTSRPSSDTEPCLAGSEREFRPLADIHLAVIITSLGGYGPP